MSLGEYWLIVDILKKKKKAYKFPEVNFKWEYVPLTRTWLDCLSVGWKSGDFFFSKDYSDLISSINKY